MCLWCWLLIQIINQLKLYVENNNTIKNSLYNSLLEYIYKCCFCDLTASNIKNQQFLKLQELLDTSNEIIGAILNANSNTGRNYELCHWEYLFSCVDIMDCLYLLNDNADLPHLSKSIECLGLSLTNIIFGCLRHINSHTDDDTAINSFYHNDPLPFLLVNSKITNRYQLNSSLDLLANDTHNWNKASKKHVSTYLTIQSICFDHALWAANKLIHIIFRNCYDCRNQHYTWFIPTDMPHNSWPTDSIFGMQQQRETCGHFWSSDTVLHTVDHTLQIVVGV